MHTTKKMRLVKVIESCVIATYASWSWGDSPLLRMRDKDAHETPGMRVTADTEASWQYTSLYWSEGSEHDVEPWYWQIWRRTVRPSGSLGHPLWSCIDAMALVKHVPSI